MPDPHAITTLAGLREVLGEPHQLNYEKSIAALDEHCRAFLAMATFCTIASCSASGKMDVSPKGDPAGFAHIVDDATIVIPERPGNRRADTFTNVLENPAVALIFLVPGIDETLRINGTATLTADPALLAAMAVEGKVPKMGLVVHIEEALMHCGKALKRGSLWDPAAQVADRGGLASMGEILHAHANGEAIGMSKDKLVHIANKDYAENVY